MKRSAFPYCEQRHGSQKLVTSRWEASHQNYSLLQIGHHLFSQRRALESEYLSDCCLRAISSKQMENSSENFWASFCLADSSLWIFPPMSDLMRAKLAPNFSAHHFASVEHHMASIAHEISWWQCISSSSYYVVSVSTTAHDCDRQKSSALALMTQIISKTPEECCPGDTCCSPSSLSCLRPYQWWVWYGGRRQEIPQ